MSASRRLVPLLPGAPIQRAMLPSIKSITGRAAIPATARATFYILGITEDRPVAARTPPQYRYPVRRCH